MDRVGEAVRGLISNTDYRRLKTITASPLPSGIVKVKTGTNTTNAVYDAWYSSVYEPSASVSSGE